MKHFALGGMLFAFLGLCAFPLMAAGSEKEEGKTEKKPFTNEPFKTGVHGRLGFGVYTSQGKESWEEVNKDGRILRLKDLDTISHNEPDSTTSPLPSAGFSAVVSRRLRLDLNLDPVGGDIGLGAKIWTPRMIVGVKFAPSQGYVWKDPYKIGRRWATSADELSGTLSLEKIYTLFDLSYNYQYYHVHEEQSGEYFFPEYNPTPFEDEKNKKIRDSLRRDSQSHRVRLDVRIPLLPKQGLFSKVGGRYGFTKAKGEVNSHQDSGGSASLLFTKAGFMVRVGGQYVVSNYKKRHPIFDKKRKDTATSVQGTVGYSFSNGFLRGVGLTGFVTHGVSDSNIRFYRSHGTAVGALLSYELF